jgi:hypothetical protein
VRFRKKVPFSTQSNRQQTTDAVQNAKKSNQTNFVKIASIFINFLDEFGSFYRSKIDFYEIKSIAQKNVILSTFSFAG